MQTEHDEVARLIASVRPGRALDVGTGSGRYLPVLAGAGASTVVGLDFSTAMLARAARLPRVCGDARRLPFAGETFDLVNASLVAGDVGDLTSWIAGLARVLAPGGRLIYSDFHPSWARYGWRRTFQTADGRTIDIPYTPHTLDEHARAMARAGLDLIALREPPLRDDRGAPLENFRRAWGDPPVLVIAHAAKPAAGRDGP
jgi:malonyl-CoA O-methyltransferase